MSARSFQHNSKQSFCGVLPDIVANYQTLMCNPYSKTKSRHNQPSKIPVASSRGNNNTKPVKMQCPGYTISTQVPRPVPVPVSTAKQSRSFDRAAALPEGMFCTQKLSNFKIPKLSHSTSNTSSSTNGKHQPRKQSLSTVTISKNSTVNNANTTKTEKPSRIPTLHATKPKPNQPKHKLPSTSTSTKSTSSTINNAAAQCNNNSKRSDSNVKPWPYGILPCSRYEIKWGDPAYTGSYVDGEWWYDVVGAASKPMNWPDTLNIFPDVPTGIFELRSVERNDAPSEKSAACEEKPVNCKDVKQVTIDSNAFQPASSQNFCLADQSKNATMSSLSQYTTVQAVTQPTTIYKEARVASCHSAGVAKQLKHDSYMKSCMKLTGSVTQPKTSSNQVKVASCSSGISKQTKPTMKPHYSNGHKRCANLSSDLSSVNQLKTLHNPSRKALCHTVALTEQMKRETQAVGTKLHNTIRREGHSLKGNKRKPFPNIPSDPIYKRGIKRAANDNSNTLLNKRCRMERQN